MNLRHRGCAITALLILPAAALSLVGCGSQDTPAPKPIALEPPTTPTAADCGLSGKGSRSEAENPPAPGIYTYKLVGVRKVRGDSPRTTKLPQTMGVTVTPAVREGAQSCFVLQRKYETSFGETATIVINGSDYLIRSGEFQTGGEIIDLLPDPPILLFSGDQLDWSGAFRGQTSGRYRAEVIGRKRIRVGGKSVQAVGIDSTVSYSGEIDGQERSIRWVSVNSGLALSESVHQRRAFGLDTLILDYKSKLESLKPH